MTWRGVLSGVLALVALEAIVRTNESADRFGGLLSDIGSITQRIVSPTVAAIPDLRETTTPSSTTS